MHVQVNEIVKEKKPMNGLVKLLPDVPIEIALSCTDGTKVVSPRGTPAVKYALVDGRTFFATQYVAAKFKKLKIEPRERIALCMRNIDGKSITLVERVPVSERDPSAERAVNDGVEPPDLRPPEQDNTCPSPPSDDSTSEQAAVDTSQPELLSELTLATANGCESAAPITQLERALKIAILASHSAEQYGKEIGYPIRFDQESVKSMAVTVLIGMQGGRD
jgi:hypothetical protein